MKSLEININLILNLKILLKQDMINMNLMLDIKNKLKKTLIKSLLQRMY